MCVCVCVLARLVLPLAEVSSMRTARGVKRIYIQNLSVQSDEVGRPTRLNFKHDIQPRSVKFEKGTSEIHVRITPKCEENLNVEVNLIS